MPEFLSAQGLVAVLLRVAFGLYAFSALWWLLEVFVLRYGWKETEEVWGLDDIQVRILTTDTESVVQQTVNAVPDGIADSGYHRG